MEARTVYKSSDLQKQADGTYQFVASNETPDRYGDIIRADGWELKNYRSNPIVLFGHQHDVPVGVSTRVWVEDKQLMQRIKLADEGTSPFIDTLRKLVDQRIIRAVSVGFKPTVEPNYIKDPKTERITGLEFIGQELLEISLVSVPANPDSLAMAKSMNIPAAHMERIFSRTKGSGALAQMSIRKAELEMIKLGVSSVRK